MECVHDECLCPVYTQMRVPWVYVVPQQDLFTQGIVVGHNQFVVKEVCLKMFVKTKFRGRVPKCRVMCISSTEAFPKIIYHCV